MNRPIIIALLLMLIVQVGKSQQDASISQYMFNGLYINPAYAGSHDYISTSIDGRKQWAKFPGSPQTAILGIDGKVRNQNMGLGLLVSNDQLGITNNTEINLVYSYFIKTGDNSRLSFGLKAGVSNFQENLGELVYWDQDPLVQTDYTSYWIPKFGFGMYYYTQQFYLGLSVPTILTYNTYEEFGLDMDQYSTYKRHYLLTSGYAIKLSDKFVLKPFTLIKFTPTAPIQADFNLAALYAEKIWLGIGYRTSQSMIAMIQIQINHNLRIGYSYDFQISPLSKYLGGSNEIMIGLDMGGNIRKFKSVRYF